MLKTKNSIKLKNLEKLGFEKQWFGLYGLGDYIPEYYYVKYYKKYYIETNHYYFDIVDGELKYFRLFKIKNHKELKFSKIHKIVRVFLKQLKQLKESLKCS